jgi:hypothetical protein
MRRKDGKSSWEERGISVQWLLSIAQYFTTRVSKTPDASSAVTEEKTKDRHTEWEK